MKIRRRLVSIVPWVVLCIGLGLSCRSPVASMPTVTGVIEELRQDPLMILVRAPSAQCGTWFSVDSRTEIRVATSTGSTRVAHSDDLSVGVRVSAWADGDYLLSCPGQARAQRVVIDR
jgi:hypothetical protein